jgi:hypothetical protein
MTVRPPSAHTAADVVDLLQMLIKAPHLAYLKDADAAVSTLHELFKEAQGQPAAKSMLAMVQVGIDDFKILCVKCHPHIESYTLALHTVLLHTHCNVLRQSAAACLKANSTISAAVCGCIACRSLCTSTASSNCWDMHAAGHCT